MILTVDPVIERTLRRSTLGRFNRACGIKGFYISAQGLKIGYNELRALVEAQVPAAARTDD